MPYILLAYLHPTKVDAEIFPKEQYKLYYSLVLQLLGYSITTRQCFWK